MDDLYLRGNWFVKSLYLCYAQVDTHWYWNEQPQHHFTTVPTCTIIHPRLEVNAVTYFNAMPTSICTRTQAKKYISRQPICLTDSEYDYILEEIVCRDKIEFERDVEVLCASRHSLVLESTTPTSFHHSANMHNNSPTT